MGGLSDCRPTRAEVDLGAVVANFRALRRFVRGSDVWPVVKADAYGHGVKEVVRALRREPVAGFCVATPSEGREVRAAGADQPILVMGGVWEGGARDGFGMVCEYGLSAAVQRATGAERLSRAAREHGVGPASVWLKVDSGMGRLGIEPAAAAELAELVEADPALSLDGLFSNLATADALDPGREADYVAQQADAMAALCDVLEQEGLLPRHRTLANCAAALHYPATWEPGCFTGIRPGLGLYGASLTAGSDPIELRPAMRLVACIGGIRELPAGAYVGYGLGFRTARATRVALLPVGYHDGVPRSLSNRGVVWLRGRRAPIIGRISMDLTLVDVTDVPGVAVGDQVVLFGPPPRMGGGESRDSRFAAMLEATMSALEAEPGQQIPGSRQGVRPVSVEEVAESAGTIPHEILCRIGVRVPRVYAPAGGDPQERES